MRHDGASLPHHQYLYRYHHHHHHQATVREACLQDCCRDPCNVLETCAGALIGGAPPSPREHLRQSVLSRLQSAVQLALTCALSDDVVHCFSLCSRAAPLESRRVLLAATSMPKLILLRRCCRQGPRATRSWRQRKQWLQ